MTGQAVNKTLGCAVRKAAQPNDAQLAAINGYAVEAQTADSVYVRTAWAGHNAIDRDGEVIDDALLMDIARTLPGKGLFVRHPSGWDGDSGPGVGRIFESRVVEMTLDEARTALREPTLQWPPGVETARLLETSFYIPRTDKHAGLIGDMDAGVAGDVSLGFRPGDRADIADGAGNRIARRLLGPGEGYELSLVWLGAQPGARVHKAANGGAPNHDEDDDMSAELKQQLDQLQADHKTLRVDLDAANIKAGSFDAIKAACKAAGVDVVLLDKPDDLAAAIKAGHDYKASLLDDIVKADRLLGLCGDSDDDVAATRKEYAGMSVAKLKGLNERLQKSVAATGAGTGDDLGSDPNPDKPGAQDQPDPSKATAADPIHNPMLQKSA